MLSISRQLSRVLMYRTITRVRVYTPCRGLVGTALVLIGLKIGFEERAISRLRNMLGIYGVVPAWCIPIGTGAGLFVSSPEWHN